MQQDTPAGARRSETGLDRRSFIRWSAGVGASAHEPLADRAARRIGEVRDLIARAAFTQLSHSPLLLAGTLAGMALTYVAPPALLFASGPRPRRLGLVAWALMALSFLPTLPLYRLSPLWAPLLRLAASFYAFVTWLSAVRSWRGRGGEWKGRAQARRPSGPESGHPPRLP